jgi:pyridoxamine 5'-phosphate oxidase
MTSAGMPAGHRHQGLDERDLHPDPMEQFRAWFAAAISAQLTQPTAATLATATPDGAPSARVILLKGVDSGGFVFYTNYESRKSRELAANPRAALVFYWAELERQVRAEGEVARTSAEESDAYFRTRPEGSRIGTWTSQQSEVIGSRDVLERRFQELAEQYADGQVPRPPYWGGYRLTPHVVEFWQGRPNRLHDRLRYVRGQGERWRIERLAP